MTNPRPPAYYEDFAVGQVYSAGPYRVDKARLIAFAEEFDPQAAHTDEAAAAQTQFGRLVASGWHTAAIAMRLMISGALPPVAGGGMGAGVEQMMWPNPVLPGDELRLQVEITGARVSRSRPEKGLLNLLVTMANQDGAPVLKMATTMILLTRPA